MHGQQKDKKAVFIVKHSTGSFKKRQKEIKLFIVLNKN